MPSVGVLRSKVRKVDAIDPDRAVVLGSNSVGLTTGVLGAEHSNVMPPIGEGPTDILNVNRRASSVAGRISFRDMPDAQPCGVSNDAFHLVDQSLEASPVWRSTRGWLGIARHPPLETQGCCGRAGVESARPVVLRLLFITLL